MYDFLFKRCVLIYYYLMNIKIKRIIWYFGNKHFECKRIHILLFEFLFNLTTAMNDECHSVILLF